MSDFIGTVLGVLLLCLGIVIILGVYSYTNKNNMYIITDLGVCLEQEENTNLIYMKQCNNYSNIYKLDNNVYIKNIK